MNKIILFSFAILLSKIVPAQKVGQAFVDSVLSEIPKAKDDTARARMYKAVSDECVVSLPNKAAHYTKIGLEYVTKMSWQKGIAVFNLNIGRIFDNQGNYDSALYYYEISYETYKKNNLLKFTPSVLNNMGTIYQKSNFTKAIEYYTKALKEAEQVGDNEIIATCWANIGLVYFEQKDYKKAITYINKSSQIKIAHNINAKLASDYSSLANCYYYLQDTAKANAYYLMTIEKAKQYNDIVTLASAYTNLSVLEKDLNKNIALKLEAKAIWDENYPNHVIAINNLMNLGLEYFNIVKENKYSFLKSKNLIPKGRQELLHQASLNYQIALQYSKQNNDIPNVAYVSGLLAELQAYSGNYKNAYENFRIYHDLNDSIYSQENKNKIATIEGQREVLLRDKQIELNKQLITNQRKQTIALSIGIVLLGLIGFLFYRQSITRKKTNQKLELLNTELESANSTKAKFFAILSHDLRSPIANLVSFLQLQQNAPELLGEQQKQAHQQKIEIAAQGLLNTMESVLLWSKGQMESFKPQIQKTEVNEIYKKLQQVNTNSKINFIYNNASNLELQTDPNFLFCIMHNLTLNATKALQKTENATITWEALKTNKGVELLITDNGNGISQDDINKLLLTKTINSQSSGLGFYIINDMAKAIGCTIEINSAIDKGTTIKILSKQ